MASGSFKDTSKALHSAFAAAEASNPLPEELQIVVEAYLEHHQNISENDSQRLHDDLLSIYRKYVADSPEKHGPFLNLLRQVRPAIRGEKRVAEWWTLVIAPTVNSTEHKRDEIEDAREFILGVLVPEEGADEEWWQLSSKFCDRLLEAYLERTRILTPDLDSISPADEYIAQELESVLVSFGRSKPKALLSALDDLLVQKRSRAQTLGLLSSFVRTQPSDLELVLETSLIDDLINCLLLDTSTTVIELALTVLVMFLPHITKTLVSQLPKLFLVYTRILCFDLLSTASKDERTGAPMASLELVIVSCTEGWSRDGEPWQILDHTFQGSHASPPLIHFFTFLYGLFPLSFTSYLRKSRKYLKGLNFPSADEFDVDQDLIRNRSSQYQKVHLLHPNFYNHTLEDEVSEHRWANSDPIDVVAECMGLCVAVSTSLEDPGPPPTASLPPLPPQAAAAMDCASVTVVADDESMQHDKSDIMLASHSASNATGFLEPGAILRKSSQSSQGAAQPKSTAPSSPLLKPLDSPTLPPLEIITRRSSAKTDSSSRRPSEHGEESVGSPELEAFAQALSRNRSQHNSAEMRETRSLASLQREVMLLRNDLNFERYLKAQHLAHIGQLQRKNLKEATVESQTQHLINTNRALKAKLTKAEELNAQIKRETAMSRNQSKKWEETLSTKVKTYKEEEKHWQKDEHTLRSELDRALDDCHRLKKIVDDSDAQHLRTQHQLRALQMDLEEMERLKRELERQKVDREQIHNAEQHTEQAIEERDYLRNELEAARMKLQSRDIERERNMRAYENKIGQLEARLQQNTVSSMPEPGSLSPSVQQMLDSALASSHAKLTQLKKTHSRLHDKYIELEMRYQELEAERDSGTWMTKSNRSIYSNATSELSPTHAPPYRQGSSSGTASKRTSTSRPATVPEDEAPRSYHDAFDFVHSPTPHLPPPSRSGSHTGNRPSRLDGDGVGESGRSSMSLDSGDKDKAKIAPKSEVRYYGRGGAQNIGKKPKEPKPEKSKSSKSGGFRGLKSIM